MKLIEEIKNGESKTLEFKENLPKNDSITRTVVAFSNTSGGKLIIGVNDKREITGISEDNIFELKDKIISIIFESCYPNILPDIYTLNIDGKLLLVIEVFKGNLLPYFIKKYGKNNGVYIRIGATNRKADFNIIIELERQRRNISYDEELNYEIEYKNLDLSVLYHEFEKTGKKINEKKLLNLKLIKKENNKIYATNALLIILGYYSHTMVKCARFKGTNMTTFLDRKEYSEDIFSNIDNSLRFILNHINLKGEIKGLYRTDTYEIPVEALREALINAFIHRDYINEGRDVKVGVYDDIVNIVSPGGFPSSITQEDIENGRSEARNKIIANLFKELGLIEFWGTGIKRIKESCKKHGLKEPVIKETGDFVDVEIYRNYNADNCVNQNSSIKVADSSIKVADSSIKIPHDNLTEQEVEIIRFLSENNKIESDDVENLFGVKSARARRILKNMVDNNILVRLGKGRATHYKLKEL